jgi:hypothetical protein
MKPNFVLMKAGRIVLLFFVAIVFAGTALAQGEVPGVAEIKAQFYAINADRELQTDTFENEEFLEQGTDGGGMLTIWYKNDSIRKIVEWVGLSYGNITTEYYFCSDQLIFVYEKVATFVENKEGGRDLTITKTAFEGRYYIRGNTIIKKTTTGTKPFDGHGSDLVKDWLADTDKYFKLFYKKK